MNRKRQITKQNLWVYPTKESVIPSVISYQVLVTYYWSGCLQIERKTNRSGNCCHTRTLTWPFPTSQSRKCPSHKLLSLLLSLTHNLSFPLFLSFSLSPFSLSPLFEAREIQLFTILRQNLYFSMLLISVCVVYNTSRSYFSYVASSLLK